MKMEDTEEISKELKCLINDIAEFNERKMIENYFDNDEVNSGE